MRVTLFIATLLAILLQCTDATECDNSQFACATGDHCITIAWRCDGSGDCPDSSDEANCPLTTCGDNFFRCNNNKCIPNRWVCDESDDCTDNSDESADVCQNKTCNGYQCKKTLVCIKDSWRCDGANDCELDDDEEGCEVQCEEEEFKCDNKICISDRWKCDGRDDCSDGSDEKDCPDKKACPQAGTSQCKNSSECIKDEWFCDGEADCPDGSDEENCSSKKPANQVCESHEFQCKLPMNSAECVNWSWRCDHFPDCSNASDEEDCEGHTCRDDERKCDENYCIKDIFFCDGDKDCSDGTDELNCTTIEPVEIETCPDGHFDCDGDGEQCISDDKLCNGVADCINEADESKDLCPPVNENVCQKDNGGCMHICVPSILEESKRRCECRPGYQIVGNTECEDIDECKNHGTCSQVCENTKGSYKCSCIAGYDLSNHRYCKVSGGKRPELILASRGELRSYNLETYHYSLLLKDEVSATALDFNIRSHSLFWIDRHAGQVFMANLTTNVKKSIMEVHGPQGIAVDWIHGNLYVSNTVSKHIEVAKLDGSHRKILIADDNDKDNKDNGLNAQSLVVDPHNGWMYFANNVANPKIEMIGMDGQNRKTMYKDVVWPSGLTIDYVGQRLYWIDEKIRVIGSTDLDGNNYKEILSDHHFLNHPKAITVFEDYLYWTDWMTRSVHRFSKFGIESDKEDDVATIALHLPDPMDIHVYHIYRQPHTKNRCLRSQCSHLCLPSPTLSIGYLCACPDNMVLKTTSTCGFADSTDVHVVVSTEGPAYGITTDSSSQNGTDSETAPKNSSGHGVIMGIVVGILLLLGLIVAVVVFILVRRHRQRNVMSMNFDNPVYRKTTTDDQVVMEKNAQKDQSLQPLNADAEVV